MRHTREARIVLDGDRAKAQAFIPAARVVLGMLLARDGEDGPAVRTLTRMLAPGVSVKCLVVADAPPTIIIVAEASQPVDEREITVGPVLDFVTYALPGPTDVIQVARVFDAELQFVRDAEPPIGVARPSELLRASLLLGGRNVSDEQFVWRAGIYPIRVASTALPGSGPGVPIGTETYTVRTPQGERQYAATKYDSDFGWGAAHYQGELPLHVRANTQAVFVLLEQTYPSTVSIGADSRPTAMTTTSLLDILDYSGARLARIQLGPSFEQEFGGLAFRINDRIAAYDDGVYVLLRPLAGGAGSELLKWSVADGFVWATTTMPPGVVEPWSVHAGPLGPYLVSTDNGLPRLHLLDPDTGGTVVQRTVTEVAQDFGVGDPPSVSQLVEARVAVTADYVYVTTALNYDNVLDLRDSRIYIYDPTLNFVGRRDGVAMAEALGLGIAPGYIVPYEDVSLMEAA